MRQREDLGDLEAQRAAGPRDLRPAGLSDREIEVLRLVAEGYSNPQIAKRLYISRRTAEHHVHPIYTKIGVSSRAAAALFALEHDLLDPGSDTAAGKRSAVRQRDSHPPAAAR